MNVITATTSGESRKAAKIRLREIACHPLSRSRSITAQILHQSRRPLLIQNLSQSRPLSLVGKQEAINVLRDMRHAGGIDSFDLSPNVSAYDSFALRSSSRIRDTVSLQFLCTAIPPACGSTLRKPYSVSTLEELFRVKLRS